MHFLHRFDILNKITIFRPMIVRNIIIFFALFFTTNIAIAAPIDLNVRDIGVGNTGNYNDQLEEFVSPLSNFFYVPG